MILWQNPVTTGPIHRLAGASSGRHFERLIDMVRQSDDPTFPKAPRGRHASARAVLWACALLCLPLQVGAQDLFLTESPSEDGVEIIVERAPQFRYLDVIDALDAEGYQILSLTNTLLNRVRIQARNSVHLREIIISRASGTILRDAILEYYR